MVMKTWSVVHRRPFSKRHVLGVLVQQQEPPRKPESDLLREPLVGRPTSPATQSTQWVLFCPRGPARRGLRLLQRLFSCQWGQVTVRTEEQHSVCKTTCLFCKIKIVLLNKLIMLFIWQVEVYRGEQTGWEQLLGSSIDVWRWRILPGPVTYSREVSQSAAGVKKQPLVGPWH